MEQHRNFRVADDFLRIQGYVPVVGKPRYFSKGKHKAVIILSPKVKVYICYH